MGPTIPFSAVLLLLHAAGGLSWRPGLLKVPSSSPIFERPKYIETQSTLSDAYAVALHELQELESEPLCHRTAAYLLVDNCHLLAGKDEATVLTDSGRVARDFVDAYAASLAICDLERGSFRIPYSCSKFQENALSKIPALPKAELHVSALEIDKCLEGLAQSDSAWTTWVSYRHKALRFCDAARSDNEKDQNIKLYQRVTKILEALTTEIESHIQDQMGDLGNAFERTKSKMDDMQPHLDIVTRELARAQDAHANLHGMAELSKQDMERASAEARNLESMLNAMVENLLQKTEDATASYETAVGNVVARASYEAQEILSMLTDAAASSASISSDLQLSQMRTEDMAHRQQEMEARMSSIEVYADSISTRYEQHGQALAQAQQKADQILGSLDYAAHSAASFQRSISSSFGMRTWLPYIYCPLISVVMGSYGLHPSLARNVVLAGAGEVVGFVVSYLSNVSWDGFYINSGPDNVGSTAINSTSVA